MKAKNIPCRISDKIIELNKHSREEIITSGCSSINKNEQTTVDIFRPKQGNSFYNSPTNIGMFPSILDKSLLPVCKEESKSILELTLEKIVPIPFKLTWLSNYLGLNKDHVYGSKFDFEFLRYSITFNTLENAENFYQILKKAGASLQLWEHTNTIEMTFSSEFKILRSVGQSDAGLNPWNIDFFVMYFDLNRDQIKADEHSMFYYTIKFHNAHDAYHYYKVLLQKHIYPREPGGDGDLVLTNMNCEILLKEAAKYVKQSFQSLNQNINQQKLKF